MQALHGVVGYICFSRPFRPGWDEGIYMQHTQTTNVRRPAAVIADAGVVSYDRLAFETVPTHVEEA
jgi:hypothetical protein